MNARTPPRIAPRRQRRRLVALAVLGVAVAALSWKLAGGESAPRYTGPPTWSAAGRMAEARQGHAAIVLPNGEVLVAGGDGADQLLASAEVFDPRTKRWRRTGSPPVAQAPTVALLLATGKVLLGVGGTGPPIPTTGLVLYDPARGTWAAAHPLPAAVGRNASWQLLTLTDVGRGRVLALGVVRSPGRTTSSAYLYDARRDTWRAATPPPLDEAAWALRLPSGQVLVIGTATVGGRYVWEAALYDPRSGTWTATSPPPNTIDPVPPVLLSNGKVLFLSADASCGLLALGRLVGGCDLTTHAVLYDPRTGRSAATGSPTQRHVPDVVVALPDGTVLAAGGLSKTSTSSGAFIAPVADAEVYDPRTGQWSPTGSMATARAGASAVVLPSGAVLVSGGDGAGSAELYTGR
jgi:large repetitive protein